MKIIEMVLPPVSKETAILAKKLGFSIPTKKYYFEEDISGDKPYYINTQMININSTETYVAAPTQELLKKWIRDVYSLDVEPKVYTRPDYCTVLVDSNSNVISINDEKGEVQVFETYEKALEKGLIEALKILILRNIG